MGGLTGPTCRLPTMQVGTGVAAPGWCHLVVWGPVLGRGLLLAYSDIAAARTERVAGPACCRGRACGERALLSARLECKTVLS